MSARNVIANELVARTDCGDCLGIADNLIAALATAGFAVFNLADAKEVIARELYEPDWPEWAKLENEALKDEYRAGADRIIAALLKLS